ncbi:MAG: rRNA maturation RNase YbeY [Spirochaetaceae bacterium]|nr:rRNA maturation RNase YbeY [Spirochaetaceae bacterium]MCF7948032.1 rRNA maturation RNase YbeY [Spirochaetia bacterium]MCF7950410.1 rRNA maturation RNase YbeY [Spirochaetaceae bacterium]
MNRVEVSTKGIEPPVWLDKAAAFCKRILEKLDIHGWEVSLLFCDDTFIQSLNRQYRNKDEATDVLSFAAFMDEQEKGFSTLADHATITAGDIVISLDTLQRHAQEFSVAESEELKRLLIHGILHLAGMDHATNSPEEEMLQKQEELMKQMTGETIF